MISHEGRSWVAHCPELDVASQGTTIERAKKNLAEAVALVLECADAAEIERRTGGDVIVSRFEVKARRR